MGSSVRKPKQEAARTRISPFLLPLCAACGEPANLSSIQLHPFLRTHELRTFTCAACGCHQDFAVRR